MPTCSLAECCLAWAKPMPRSMQTATPSGPVWPSAPVHHILAQKWPFSPRSVAEFGWRYLRNLTRLCSTAYAFSAGIVLEMFVCQNPYIHKDLPPLCTGTSKQLSCHNNAEALRRSHLRLRTGMAMGNWDVTFQFGCRSPQRVCTL